MADQQIEVERYTVGPGRVWIAPVGTPFPHQFPHPGWTAEPPPPWIELPQEVKFDAAFWQRGKDAAARRPDLCPSCGAYWRCSHGLHVPAPWAGDEPQPEADPLAQSSWGPA